MQHLMHNGNVVQKVIYMLYKCNKMYHSRTGTAAVVVLFTDFKNWLDFIITSMIK